MTFLANWQSSSKDSFTLISGVLPPAVSALFGWILPQVMRWLSKYQGAITRSRLDRAVVARYFAFLLMSQLFIFTLIGVIFSKFHSFFVSIAARGLFHFSDSVKEIIAQIGKKSFSEIVSNLDST